MGLNQDQMVMYIIIRSDGKEFTKKLRTISQADYWLNRIAYSYPQFDFDIKRVEVHDNDD